MKQIESQQKLHEAVRQKSLQIMAMILANDSDKKFNVDTSEAELFEYTELWYGIFEQVAILYGLRQPKKMQIRDVVEGGENKYWHVEIPKSLSKEELELFKQNAIRLYADYCEGKVQAIYSD